MDWEGGEESQNVEDRRSFNRNVGLAAGGVGGVVVVILGLIFGFNPAQWGGGGGGGQGAAGPGGPGGGPVAPADPQEERLAHFTKVIFHDTEVVWDDLFNRMGRQYQKPVLTLYSDRTESACGLADAAIGPFYCPGDSRVYIDLGFFREMEQKLNAPGEFARAYVVAHEVGHHVQRLLGYSKQVDRARRTMSKVEYNKMSVRLELQADYLAGVWAYYMKDKYRLKPADIKSALHAAFEIGDDRLQKRARGTVVPDSFTHGTSKQRVRWFKRGFDTGNVEAARLLFELPYDQL